MKKIIWLIARLQAKTTAFQAGDERRPRHKVSGVEQQRKKMPRPFRLCRFIIFLFGLLIAGSYLVPEVKAVSAGEEILEAKVLASLKEEVITQNGQQYLYQELKLLVTKGSLKGQEITVESGNWPRVGLPKYDAGDRVLVSYSLGPEGESVFYLTDFVRRRSLGWLFFIFLILVVGVSRWRGLGSLLGMGLSFGVIFWFILPQINAGQDPVWVVILGSVPIILFTFYLSHGFNWKTTVAILGTLMALVLTGFLAQFFVNLARLTGYASEEAAFLQLSHPGKLNIGGLVLAGMIIAVLGVLDDITVSQSAVVEQIKKANPRLGKKDLFFRAMSVGQDHIASMVNTLVLVYAGASLPLLLLFTHNPRPFGEVINYEIISEEIIRMLVGSIGLILAVPITTFLAVKLEIKKGK